MNPTSSFSRVVLCSLAIVSAVAVARADVAMLREKGPKSGSIFANIGPVVDYAPAEKVAMKTAEVLIRLKRGDRDTLVAECEATFVLEDGREAGAGVQTFLAAFPVTGLRAQIVTVDNFKILVDGKAPPTVQRQLIEVSRRNWQLRDTPVQGQLDARFRPSDRNEPWSDGLINVGERASYAAAYAWQMATSPAANVTVKVSYSAVLKPQPISYTKSYNSSPGDDDVIPFSAIEVSGSDGPHYFFDYILVSGSTWHGPIGSETITMAWDEALGLHPARVSSTFRAPVGFPKVRPPDGWIDPNPESQPGRLIWKISGDPDRDLLIAIPQSAIAPESK